jgi:hypothetical protein
MYAVKDDSAQHTFDRKFSFSFLKEKATLLEKIEHYEREIKHSKPNDKNRFTNDRHETLNANDKFDLLDTNYEYYFERNVSSHA